MARIDLRISDEIADEIHRAMKERGFESLTAFIRQAISNELHGGESALRETEDRIAATLERLAKEVRRLQTAQQAEYALTDSFVRLFLMCVPEPSGDAVDPARARAASRYSNVLRNVARNMTGNSQASLEQLPGHE
jgi:hypothetical protein